MPGAASGARQAGDFYRLAGQRARQAAWLTTRPDMAYSDDPELLIGQTPADTEAEVRQLVRCADIFLAQSFTAEANCRFYRSLGDRYTIMARDHEARGELVLF